MEELGKLSNQLRATCSEDICWDGVGARGFATGHAFDSFLYLIRALATESLIGTWLRSCC